MLSRKLVPILVASLIFCGNLEVDGGITATGEVQSPTIQALLNQIAQLQEQIALLQAQLNGSNSNIKVVTYSVNDLSAYQNLWINIDDLFGFDVGLANISVLGVTNCSNFLNSSTVLLISQEEGNQTFRYSFYPDCHLEPDIYSYTDKLYIKEDDSQFKLEISDNYANDVSFDIHFILTSKENSN